MSFDVLLTARDVQGSIQAVRVNPDGVLLSALDVSDITLDAAITGSIETKQVSGFTDSVNVVSSIPLEIKQISGYSDSVNVVGFTASVAVVGDVEADAVDSGNPVKIGGIARTANPTAVSGGDRVSASYDDIGRQVVVPYQVRDLTATSYATLTSGSGFGTETALLAGTAGEFHDLLWIWGTNNSDAAIAVSLRAATAGTIIGNLVLPAGGMAGIAPAVPWPGPYTDHSWTVDAPDVTGATVTINALFSKEV